ncbi:MAG: transposase [Deltaproteobacteria bacterium]|nr:transposase [Deltaproteobacteria bacterium]
MSELCDRYRISRPTGYKWVDRIEAEVLDRNGQLRKNRRRQSWKHPGAVRLETAGPNEIWPADFKGQFKTGDGKYCFPLTVTDHYSRMLLLCKALRSVRTEGAKPAFRALFREHGLPDAIRTDNGQHERMHKDMKREAAHPPGANLAKQQRKLNLFQQRYNHERPHEALSGDFPAERWQPSTREHPSSLPQPDYPGHFEVRRVSSCGTFRLSGQRFSSNALAGENIGLEEVGDDLWNLVYYTTVLGRIDRQTGKITGSDNV